MDLTCPQMYMDVTHDTLGKPPESAHDALSSRGDLQCCSLVLAGGPHGAEHLTTHSGLCGQNVPRLWEPWTGRLVTAAQPRPC